MQTADVKSEGESAHRDVAAVPNEALPAGHVGGRQEHVRVVDDL